MGTIRLIAEILRTTIDPLVVSARKPITSRRSVSTATEGQRSENIPLDGASLTLDTACVVEMQPNCSSSSESL